MISPLSLEICIQIASLSLLFSVNNKMLSKVRHDIERMPSWFCQGEHSRAAPPSRPTLLPAVGGCCSRLSFACVGSRSMRPFVPVSFIHHHVCETHLYRSFPSCGQTTLYPFCCRWTVFDSVF